jgi:hypothetical protein
MGITSDKKLDNIKEKKYSTKWSPRSLTALTAKWLRKKSGAFLKSKHTPKHNVPSGTRRMVMTISKKLFHGRSLAVIAIFCTSVLIAACGGGGGSTDAPIGAAQVVAGAIKKADGCTIPQDGTTCSGTVTFSITGNPTAPKLVVGNTTMNTTTGATIAVPLTGTAPVALTVYDGNTVLDSKSVAAVCAVGSAWDGNTCKATASSVLHYTDKVYAIWTANWPFTVTKTGVTRVVNKTSLPGVLPYVNCWLASKPLPDGKVLTNCVDNTSSASGRHVLYIDPTKDELHDYGGTVPSDVIWLDVARFDQLKPEWGAKAQVSDGWYFNLSTDGRTIKFQQNGTGTISVIKVGTLDDDTIKILVSYSN